MKKLFPPMTNHISGGHIAAIFVYCFFGLILIPFLMPFIADGFFNNDLVLSWIEIAYYAINGIVIMLLLKDDLKDAAFFLRLNLKQVLLTVLIAVALMTGWTLITPDLLLRSGGDAFVAINAFPVSPLSSLMTTGFMVLSNPVFGTLCMTLLVPFSVCGIFYATGFAPACCKKSWLGYLCVSLVVLAVALFEFDWRWNDPEVLMTFIVRLPVHLVACWAYQKTDNIWTPIMAIGAFNLVASLFDIVLVALLG